MRPSGQALSTLVCSTDAARQAALDALALPMLAWIGLVCALGAQAETSRRAAGQALLHRAMADAQARLADAALSPAALAHSQGVSQRYLHRPFAAQGLTMT